MTDDNVDLLILNRKKRSTKEITIAMIITTMVLLFLLNMIMIKMTVVIM